MFATITPVPVFPSTATVLFINNVTVQPGASASYQWWLQNDTRGSLTTGTITLDGAAYAAWGTDDEYLYRYSAESLGLVIVEIVPDAVAAAASPDEAVTAPDLPAVAPAVAPVVSDEVPAAGGTND